MTKYLTAIVLVLFLADCKEDDCIDETRKREGLCPFIYLPVCGCDGKSYGNACEADLAGVISFETGACASSK